MARFLMGVAANTVTLSVGDAGNSFFTARRRSPLRKLTRLSSVWLAARRGGRWLRAAAAAAAACSALALVSSAWPLATQSRQERSERAIPFAPAAGGSSPIKADDVALVGVGCKRAKESDVTSTASHHQPEWPASINNQIQVLRKEK